MQEFANPRSANLGPAVGVDTGSNGKANSHAQAFITRWQGTTASELPTAQSFVRELCALRGVDVPHTTPGQGTMHALCQQAKAAHRFC